MRILALKTFAVTISLDYNNDNTLTALKQLTTVSKFYVCLTCHSAQHLFVCVIVHQIILSLVCFYLSF